MTAVLELDGVTKVYGEQRVGGAGVVGRRRG
ncbi:MAG: hypothetical protein QOK49_529, partial [Baekduia sp.]|nr:hypothetical protein [Baekduia sp.]